MKTIKIASFSICLFFCISQLASAQKPVVISGQFQPEISDTEVSVYKPYSGVFNIFYPDIQSEAKIENSKFKIVVNIGKAGFIRIQSKGMPKTFFYAEPGDSIQITFITDSAGVTKTVYTGSNAGANNLLSEKKLLNNGLDSQEIILSAFKTEKSADSTYHLLEQEIAEVTSPLQSLLKEQKITKSCYDAMISETEQKLLSWANGLISGYFDNNEKIVPLIKLNRSEMKKLARLLNDRYDPYNIKNRMATTNGDNCYVKASLSKNGILPTATQKTQRWTQYDKQFGVVVNQISTLDYAPDENQMFYLGNSLLIATVFKPMSDNDFVKIFDTYKSAFPKSPYIPVITAYLAENKKVMTQETINSEFGLYELVNGNKQLIEKELVGIDSIKTIQTLIKNYFGGHRVFVDYWATWCSPCVAEFRNEPRLHQFLKENNIQTLYVSIDNKRSMDNWKKTVERYQLNGFHYLANQEVYANLDKWFKGIPRYMLFDSNGEILNDNLLRPSKQEELFNQIRKFLPK
jgi:thiol-disulfide isomerase/thioredoxin